MRNRARPPVPPGWDTNPSSWGERLPIIGLALLGFAIATYLSLYQLEVLDTVWEPFFGDGSETILNSRTSEVLPVPDAALVLALSFVEGKIQRRYGGGWSALLRNQR